ncbi:MAG: hypothetical protein GTO41_00860, partial [Burkholderiales bacterium]|nr:hypothetical protein [Burkholderiales bacterium]
QVDEAPSYDIYVHRSFADYLWRWLEDAAQEYGVAIIAQTIPDAVRAHMPSAKPSLPSRPLPTKGEKSASRPSSKKAKKTSSLPRTTREEEKAK